MPTIIKSKKINYKTSNEDTVGNLQYSDVNVNINNYLNSKKRNSGKMFPLFQVCDTYESSSLTDADSPLIIDKKIDGSKKRRKLVKKSRRRKASVSSNNSSSAFNKVNHSVNVTNDLNSLEQQVLQEILTKHSHIQTYLPFRTYIKGEIRTLNDNAIYSKQYPYPYSVNNFVNK